MKITRSNSLYVRLLLAGFVTLSVFSSQPSGAATISVNFGPDLTVDATETAGAVPVAGNRWNNTGDSATGTITSLRDGTGAAVSGDVAWSSVNTYYSASTGSTATSENGDLTAGYLDDSGAGWSVIVNTPYLLNDLYIIHATDQGSPATISAVSVNGKFYKGDGTSATIAAAGIADSWTATNWTNANTLAESANFIKVTGQPLVSVAGFSASPGRSAIAGIQVSDGYTGTLRYWDVNGTSAGAGGTGDGNLNGTWGTSAYWTASATGEVATGAWTPGGAAVFSAGNELYGDNVVTVSGTQTADAVWVQEGGIALNGGTLDLTAGLGLLRSDDLGLTLNSKLTAGNLTLLGSIDLNHAADVITGVVTVGDFVTLGANHSFGGLAGSGDLDLGVHSLTLGGAIDSVFSGEILSADGTSTVTKSGSGTLSLMDASTGYYGSMVVSAGTLDLNTSGNLYWNVSGPGNLSKSGTGQLTVISNLTPTGALKLQGGTLQMGNGSVNGSIGAATPISISNGALLTFNPAVSTLLASSVSFASTGGTLRMQGGTPTDTLTLSGAVGANSTIGTLRATLGKIALASGASVKVAEVGIQGTPAGGRAVVEVQSGASLTTRYFNIGQDGGNSGIFNLTGGIATMEAGGSGVRIGHWDNSDATSGSEINVTAGTFDASLANLVTNVGWDGYGIMKVGGGASPAIAKVWGISQDANGDSTTYSDITSVLPNGTLEIGAGGTVGASANDYISLGGGTLRGSATSTWAARVEVTSDSVVSADAGAIVNLSGTLTGAGRITKTGTGTLRLSGIANTYSGTIETMAGNIEVTGSSSANLLVSGSGTTYLGIGTVPAVTVSAGGTIRPGSATTTGMATSTQLTLSGGNATFRVGTAGDQIIAPGFAVTSPSTVTILPANVLTAPSSYPVVDYSGSIGGLGAAGLTLVFANPHYTGNLKDDTATTSLVVNLTSADSVVWKGNPSSTWDTNTTANWVLGSNNTVASKYYDFDIARFDDSGLGASDVTLTGAIQPASVQVANTSGTYTFQGTGLTGSTSLAKSGPGTLTLLNPNVQTGTTSVTGGTLNIGNGGTSGSLGNPAAATVSDGTLVFNRSDDTSFGIALSGTGTFRKSGSNTLTLNSAAKPFLPTHLTIDGGSVVVTASSFNSNRMTGNGVISANPNTTLVVAAAHGLGGDNLGLSEALVLTGSTLTLNGEQYLQTVTLAGATINGTSEMRVPNTGNYTVTGTAPSFISAKINQAFSNATWNIADVTGNAAADLTISGEMSNNFGFVKSGAGTLLLAGVNTYVGNTVVNEGSLSLAESGQLTFAIKGNHVNNSIGGAGALELQGSFNIDLTGADASNGNSWVLVSPNLQTNYSSTFGLVGFTRTSDGIFTKTDAGVTWTFTTSSGTLTTGSASSDYSTWLSAYTFPAGADSSPAGDPDGDGRTNQFEYAFGLNPTSGASLNPITAVPNKSTGVFKYVRRAGTGIAYSIQTSGDLLDWNTDPAATAGQVEGAVDAGGNQEVTVTVSSSASAAGSLFVRVSAE